MDRVADVRTILNNVSAVWIIVDRAGTVLFVNKHTEKFQHLIEPEIREGHSIFPSIPKSWRDLAQNILQSLLSDQESANLEASYSDRGKDVFLDIKCNAIRDDSGYVSQIFIEAVDVTPQKIFEKKITIVAREYQTLIENANAVIIGIDIRGYVTEWNERASQVTGYSKDESFIQKLSHLLLWDEEDRGFASAIADVSKGAVISNFEMICRTKNGSKITILINATPRKSADAEVIGILLIGQDITELSAYRQSLEQKVIERTQALKSSLENERELVQVKDRFVSMASHEFRSPISYIHSNIQAITANIKNLSDDEIVQRLQKVQSQAEHLTALLEDVMTIGKTGAAKIKANLKKIALKDFFLKINDEVQSNTHNTHRIKFDFQTEVTHLESDENLLRNIFVNLLTNAIKFSPGKDEVYLSVGLQDNHVAVRVEDRGLGIEEKDLSLIFEPFHRGENVQKIKGTGLGLPIVKRAVETLGGELQVESIPGKGTLFIILLKTTTVL
jgi:PAS domain S-box-containing protein